MKQRDVVLTNGVPADAILDVEVGDRKARFVVEQKKRAPYPSELDRLSHVRRALSNQGEPLLIVPFVSEALAISLTEAGWSWADAQGDFDLRASGLVLRQRRTMAAPAPRRKTLPRGFGSFAIIRALISLRGHEEPHGATALAAQAKVSQPRASQVLRQLQSLQLVERTGSGQWRPHREALLDRFLAEYPGPGGSERYFYSLDAPTQVALHAAHASTPQRPVAVSADVGPDLIRAWRRPSLLILYVKHVIDPADLGLVEAQGRHDANVIIRMPDDQSVFPAHALVAQLSGAEIPLADPSQMIWDLEDLGGADRMEAAERLRQWLLTHL